MAEAPQGSRLPSEVPSLARFDPATGLTVSGIEWRTARALEEFLRGMQDVAGAVQGSDGLVLGVGANPGDILVFDGERWIALPVGSDGQVLTVDTAEDIGLAWETPVSGSGNAVRVSVAFGVNFTDKAQTVVTGETWVTANSNIVGAVLVPAADDPDELYLLDFKVVISDLVAGDGFTVTVYSRPEAKGTYEVMCIGA